MKGYLEDAARSRLAHYAGALFQRSTIACLNGEFGVEFDDRLESNLGKAFHAKVLEPLDRVAALI